MKIDLDKRRAQNGDRPVVVFEGKEYQVHRPRLRDLALFDRTNDWDMDTLKRIVDMLFPGEWETFQDLEIEELHEVINAAVPGANAGKASAPSSGGPGDSPSSTQG
jgi:hypothetical protein